MEEQQRIRQTKAKQTKSYFSFIVLDCFYMYFIVRLVIFFFYGLMLLLCLSLSLYL